MGSSMGWNLNDIVNMESHELECGRCTGRYPDDDGGDGDDCRSRDNECACLLKFSIVSVLYYRVRVA